MNPFPRLKGFSRRRDWLFKALGGDMETVRGRTANALLGLKDPTFDSKTTMKQEFEKIEKECRKAVARLAPPGASRRK